MNKPRRLVAPELGIKNPRHSCYPPSRRLVSPEHWDHRVRDPCESRHSCYPPSERVCPQRCVCVDKNVGFRETLHTVPFLEWRDKITCNVTNVTWNGPFYNSGGMMSCIWPDRSPTGRKPRFARDLAESTTKHHRAEGRPAQIVGHLSISVPRTGPCPGWGGEETDSIGPWDPEILGFCYRFFILTQTCRQACFAAFTTALIHAWCPMIW